MTELDVAQIGLARPLAIVLQNPRGHRLESQAASFACLGEPPLRVFSFCRL
jgi:hypothetical protein